MKVVISGGGTGGHIFPAISIANAIKKRFPDAEILFVGAKDRMEMEKVPAAGYEIIGLEVSGLYRKQIWKNFMVLWKLLKSLFKAKKLMKKFRPDVAIGVGGYASGPTLQVANSLKIPTILQEQNSFAGVTNKILGKRAARICVAYEDMERFFPADKLVLTGNPCRQDLSSDIDKDEAYNFFGLDKNKKTILIVGGSLGARTLNDSVLNNIADISQSDVQILWQGGGYYHKSLLEALTQQDPVSNLHLYDFIARMDLAYKVADLVISRAGAGSISELCILGKPTILVPSPNVAEDHQTMNAMALVKRDATLLIKDSEATDVLIGKALELVHNDTQLRTLTNNISKMAELNSADRIVDEIEKVIAEKQKK